MGTSFLEITLTVIIIRGKTPVIENPERQARIFTAEPAGNAEKDMPFLCRS
jgi:hypothetical protein